MKRALTLSLALAFTLPLLAEESKKTTEKNTSATAETKTAQTITAQNAGTLVPAQQPVTAQDSPLVAAAKRANRLGKKPTNVITNETLAQYGRNARITTVTATGAELPAPAPPATPTPEMKADAKKAEQRRKLEEREAKARKIAEERQRTLAQKAEASEEGLYDLEEDDPAMLEGEHSDAAAKANEKPPEH